MNMNPQEKLGKVLITLGAATIVIGLVLAAVLGEPLALIAVLVGAIDVTLGFLFSSGVLTAGGRRGAAEAAAAGEELGTTADGEPISSQTNPFARED